MDYVARDYRLRCEGYSFVMRQNEKHSNCRTISRRVLLHSLERGTIPISVIDMVCPRCSGLHTFDGKDESLFALSRSTVFSRELIDYWIYIVAMLGGNIREAFELSVVLLVRRVQGF